MASIRTSVAVLIVAFCVTSVPPPALAQMQLRMTVERFQNMAARGEPGDILIANYLHAFTQAAEYAHFDYVQRGSPQKKLYCARSDVRITSLDMRDELLREFAAQPDVYKPTTPVGPIVLQILRRKYPCS